MAFGGVALNNTLSPKGIYTLLPNTTQQQTRLSSRRQESPAMYLLLQQQQQQQQQPHRHPATCGACTHPEAVGVSPRVALSIGIAVDHRRRNRSQESLTANVNRLKLYLSKLVLFQRGSKPKKGLAGVPADTPKSQLHDAADSEAPQEDPSAFSLLLLLPARVITEEEKKFRAYATLRKQLRDAKNVGKHAKKLAEEAEAEKRLTDAAPLGCTYNLRHHWPQQHHAVLDRIGRAQRCLQPPAAAAATAAAATSEKSSNSSRSKGGERKRDSEGGRETESDREG
ncbi:hypothetical protein Emed_001870 [Eimeria media]